MLFVSIVLCPDMSVEIAGTDSRVGPVRRSVGIATTVVTQPRTAGNVREMPSARPSLLNTPLLNEVGRTTVSVGPIPVPHTITLPAINSLVPLLATLASAPVIRRHRSAEIMNNPTPTGETNLANGPLSIRRPFGPISLDVLAGATSDRFTFRKTPPPRRNQHRAITDLVEGQ